MPIHRSLLAGLLLGLQVEAFATIGQVFQYESIADSERKKVFDRLRLTILHVTLRLSGSAEG